MLKKIMLSQIDFFHKTVVDVFEFADHWEICHKGAVALCHFGYETFACRIIP